MSASAKIVYPYKMLGADGFELEVYVSGFITEAHACLWAERFTQLMCNKGISGVMTGVTSKVHAGDLLLSSMSTPEQIYKDIQQLLGKMPD